MKQLIIYYSWSGNTAALAHRLQQLTSADVFEIKVPAGTFSTDMYATSDIAKQQLTTGQLPALNEPLPNFSEYDEILVGGPVWSGSPATPVLALLELLKHANVSVQLAPFYTHAGSAAEYEADFKKASGQLTVLPGLSIAGSGASDETEIQKWVNSLK